MRMIAMPKNFIGARPGRVYSWGDSASIQTASGTAVTFPQAAERPLSGLNIYGHSTQDGTPSPDNPVPIVSAGDDGEINVSVSDGGTQSQTLTLSTPGGLPGIPVDSGGNYTDESGQQWICDEIDLKRGKYVQRVGSVLADGTVNKFTASADNVFWNLNTDHTAPGVIAGKWYLSIYFSKDFFNANESGEFIYVMSEKGQEYFDTIEDLNAFCVEKNAEGNPLIIYFPMDPIETDLPAPEIAAL